MFREAARRGWRTLLLDLADRVEATPEQAEFFRLVRDSWDGRASVGSVGYRLVRRFRLTVRKDLGSCFPRAETLTHFFTMGMHEDLDRCAEIRANIFDFAKHRRPEAYTRIAAKDASAKG